MYQVIDLNIMVAVLIVTILYFVRFVYQKIRKYQSEKLYVEYIFVLYIIGIVKLAFLPIILMDKQRLIYMHGSSGRVALSTVLNVIPISGIREMIDQQGYAVMFLSFILLMPMVFFLSVCKKRFTNWQKFLVICAVSLGIEVIQLIISLLANYAHSTCSVDDFLLNITGAGIVLLLSGFFSFLSKRKTKTTD